MITLEMAINDVSILAEMLRQERISTHFALISLFAIIESIDKSTLVHTKPKPFSDQTVVPK